MGDWAKSEQCFFLTRTHTQCSRKKRSSSSQTVGERSKQNTSAGAAAHLSLQPNGGAAFREALSKKPTSNACFSSAAALRPTLGSRLLSGQAPPALPPRRCLACHITSFHITRPGLAPLPPWRCLACGRRAAGLSRLRCLAWSLFWRSQALHTSHRLMRHIIMLYRQVFLLLSPLERSRFHVSALILAVDSDSPNAQQVGLNPTFV